MKNSTIDMIKYKYGSHILSRGKRYRSGLKRLKDYQ